MKKIISILLSLVLVFALVACGNTNDNGNKETTAENNTETSAENNAGNKSTQAGQINVISREDGSGTRGAFVEITKVVDENGNDLTTPTAAMIGTTGGVIESVSGDNQAIGYASLGSVEFNKDVKMLKVDGVEPTLETVLSGEYSIQRPLNIAYKEDTLSDLAKDFVNYTLSKEGQEIAVEAGFVQVDANAPAYEGKDLEGTIKISGSTSVGPLIHKIAETYKALHPNVNIEINEHGSSAGMTDAMEGLNDIGMASRELKDNEKEQLAHKAIAKDGIALIVAPGNSTENISMETIQKIYKGELTDWSEVK